MHLLVVVITGKNDARSEQYQMMNALGWSYSTGKGISV
jgi:hypothetical protein